MRYIRAVATGVVLGLGAVVIHGVVTDDAFQTAIREAVEEVKLAVEEVKRVTKSQKREVSEEDVLREAFETDDPKVNQAWVESQWEAVLG